MLEARDCDNIVHEYDYFAIAGHDTNVRQKKEINNKT